MSWLRRRRRDRDRQAQSPELDRLRRLAENAEHKAQVNEARMERIAELIRARVSDA